METVDENTTVANAAARKPRTRDAEATKARILDAAKREFAKNGLGGARVDVIAEKARANKRMIYHYFESKEGLFQTILENAYVDIRTAEQKLNLDHLAPKEALERLVRFTWDYYLKNPEFITLVNSENLHRAKHLKKSEIVKVYSRKFVSMVTTILDRGVGLSPPESQVSQPRPASARAACAQAMSSKSLAPDTPIPPTTCP